MNLKDLLGDAESFTLDEITEKLKGYTVFENAKGEYLPKAKYDEARTVAKDAQKELVELKATLEGDDAPAKRIEALEAKLALAQKELEGARGEVSKRDRLDIALGKVGGDKKLARLLVLDAEALMSDDVDFDEAVGKAIEADPDYAPKADDGDKTVVKVGTGPAAKSGVAGADALTAAIDGVFARPGADTAK